MNIDCLIDCEGIDEFDEKMENAVKCAVAQSLQYEDFEGDAEVSVVITDNEGIRKLNRTYRDKDSATDVLSFPEFSEDGEFSMNPENNMYVLGDIVISIDKVFSQAQEYGHSPLREISFLVVHSCLHLLGYDHETSKEDEKEMFGKQKEIMEKIRMNCNVFSD